MIIKDKGNNLGANFDNLAKNVRKKKYLSSMLKHRSKKNSSGRQIFYPRTEDINESNYQYEKLKLAEMSCLSLSVGGFLCAVIVSQLDNANSSSEEDKMYLVLALLTSSMITFTLLFAIYWRAQKELKWQQSKLIYSSQDNLTTTKKIRLVILELFFNAIHPFYGFSNVTIYMHEETLGVTFSYSIYSILSVIMMIRIYHLLRFISSISKYRTSRGQRLCKIFGSQPNIWFALKSLMHEKPVIMISCLFIVGLLICSYAIYVIEAPTLISGGKDFTRFNNCIWFIIVTMATVGYGDYYPVTLPGRIIAIFACFLGILIVSLTTLTFSNLLRLDLGEDTSLKVLERLWFKEDFRNEAAWVLTSAIRYSLMRKEYSSQNLKIQKQFSIFRKHLKQFQFLRYQKKTLYDYDCYTDRIEVKLLETIDLYEKILICNKKSKEILDSFPIQETEIDD